MIILDTNLVSELMREDPDITVLAWVEAQMMEDLWTTTVTVFELRYGILKMPPGRRRTGLMTAVERVVSEALAGRIFPLDIEAAEAAAHLMVTREQRGHVVSVEDTLIAGIAVARRASIATRNRRDFADAGIAILDPWGG